MIKISATIDDGYISFHEDTGLPRVKLTMLTNAKSMLLALDAIDAALDGEIVWADLESMEENVSRARDMVRDVLQRVDGSMMKEGMA